MPKEPALHWNVGGQNGWTTACGIESASFTDKIDEIEDVSCGRCCNTAEYHEVTHLFHVRQRNA